MKNLFLKLLACLLVAAMLITSSAVCLFAEPNGEEAADGDLVVEPVDIGPDEGEPTDPGALEGDEAPAAEGDEAAPAEDEEAAPAEGDEAAPAEGEEAAPAEGEEAAPAEGEEEADEAVAMITDEEALAACQKVAENDKFELYCDFGVEDAELERIALVVKETGFIWWSNPINALADTSTNKSSLRQNRLSNIAYKYGNATDLIASSAFLYSYRESTSRGNCKYEIKDNEIVIRYTLRTASCMVPVHVALDDEGLYTYIETSEIKENNGYREEVKNDQDAEDRDTIVLTEVAMFPYMGAAPADEEGYMLIPDGSGAIINLNNGKGNYSDYSQPLYGRDITTVKEVEPDMVEQAYLPVMAMVRQNNGLVMIATDGDTFANVNANVSYSKNENSWYNDCYFSFTLRSTDNYYMTGDSSAIMVFEKGDGKILVPRVGVKFIPVTGDGDTVTTGEIADIYRNYLIEEKGLAKAEGATEPALYIDMYGGTLKSKSILGIPIKLKTAYTSFKQASDIVSQLNELGVGNMVVNYNDWSEDSMSSKIDTGDSVASCLGGKSQYKKMLKQFADLGVDYYASVSGVTFKSNGNGFWTLFNTAYRVSKSYSRQYIYNIAYGTPDTGVAPALMSPRSIEKLSKKVSKNLGKYEQGAGLGIISNTLWSDFSNKYRTNRYTTAQYVVDYYKAVKESNGKVIADAPNAYLLPYVTRINNLTLQSSQFKLTDYDIPFYQMVMHGYVDYASEAINGTPDTTIAVLKAIAAGSNIHFDFMYEEASELVNTDYVNKFYCCYEGWLDEAAKAYQLVSEILTPAKDATISSYDVDGKVITTTYSNGYETVVNLGSGDIKAGGKTYNYTDYVKGGSD